MQNLKNIEPVRRAGNERPTLNIEYRVQEGGFLTRVASLVGLLPAKAAYSQQQTPIFKFELKAAD
jgi:hypothetical protein